MAPFRVSPLTRLAAPWLLGCTLQGCFLWTTSGEGDQLRDEVASQAARLQQLEQAQTAQLQQLKQAETNIFYGKKGYSVVQSPRNGTDNRLNELVAQIISEMIL